MWISLLCLLLVIKDQLASSILLLTTGGVDSFTIVFHTAARVATPTTTTTTTSLIPFRRCGIVSCGDSSSSRHSCGRFHSMRRTMKNCSNSIRMKKNNSNKRRQMVATRNHDTNSDTDTTATAMIKRRRSSRLFTQQNEILLPSSSIAVVPALVVKQEPQEPQQKSTSSSSSLLSSSIIAVPPLAIKQEPQQKSSSTTSHSSSSSLQLLHDWINHTDVSFHYIPPAEAQQIQTKLLQWYSTNRRKLPWRGDPPPWNGSTAVSTTTSTSSTTRTKKKAKVGPPPTETNTQHDDDSYLHRTYPMTTYGVWVSEVMLQQTRVEAVVVKWCQFMSSFPNVTALAKANITDVNAIWAGLGYYRRLQFLHTAAQIVVTKYDGIIPVTIDELRTLPGIGRYTAHAIASIAHQQPNVPVVDGNVCRVLSRLRGIGQTIKSSTFKDQYGWTLAQQIVTSYPQNNDTTDENNSNDNNNNLYNSGDINQALMELGATYCSPSGTGIHPNDPLKQFYLSTKLGIELANSINNDNPSKDCIPFPLEDDGHVNEPHCQLCAKSGIPEIMQQFRNQLLSSTSKVSFVDTTDKNYFDMVQQLGHSLFPLPPPKVHKKEELLVIAAMCRFGKKNDSNAIDNTDDHSGKNDENRQWLLVKRPENGGLLSGQWEFPSITVWQSEEYSSGRRSMPRIDMSNQVPIITISQRRKRIYSLLDDLDGTVTGGRSVKLQTITENGPIHHIFSHVRHSMYVEYACCGCCVDTNDEAIVTSNDDAMNRTTKEHQWMTRSDMNQVGITSGVKKILDTVETKLRNNNSDGSHPKTSSTPTKR